MTLLVPRRQLHLGPLLAEGGEGRVYELSDRPDQVFKAFRRPPAQAGLAELVDWTSVLAPAGAARVRASTAWPVGVVVEDPSPRQTVGKGGEPTAAGLLLPRAPRRFSLRHRDGRSHLASLSYLTADPARRSGAYGISLPEPMSPDRLGLVYALARLLEAFESATPRVSHGDLSAKNVLWSLARGPEIFVLDCDNGERWECGRALGPLERRRAMTPNWDDPAVAGGTNPGADADRYSLALIFLRVCGAAHFPIQKRQKAGEVIDLEVGVPGSGRRARSLGAGAPLWDLCARGLGAEDPAWRPPASAWVETLAEVIVELGATRILDAVSASQGRGDLGVAGPGVAAPVSGTAPTSPPARVRGAVTVRPVASSMRIDSGVPRRGALATAAAPGVSWTASRTATGGLVGGATGSGIGGYSGGAASLAGVSATSGGPAARSGPSAWRQLRQLTGSVLRWMVEEHRRTLRYLRTPDRRWRGLLRIPWCAAVDFLAGCVVLFVVAMVASPFLGI